MTDLSDLPTIAESAALPAPTDLKKIDLQAVALAQFGDWRADVAAAQKTLSTTVHDLSIPARIAEAKTLRQRLIGAPRAEVNKIAAALKSKLAKVSKAVGAEADAAVTAYDALDPLITPQIEAAEARIEAERREREEAEQRRLAALREAVAAWLAAWVDRCNAEGITAERIGLGIAALEDKAPQAEWAEVNDFWQSTKSQTLATMRRLQVEAQKREDAARLAAERAELERQAAELKRQRDELAAQQAAIRAEAQRLENERVAAELAAAQAKLLAEQERVAGIQKRIREIQAAATGHEKASSADLTKAIVAVSALDVSEAQYAEFSELAHDSKLSTLMTLKALHYLAVGREEREAAERAAEAERAEAERQCIAERERESQAQAMALLNAMPEAVDCGAIEPEQAERISSIVASLAADSAITVAQVTADAAPAADAPAKRVITVELDDTPPPAIPAPLPEPTLTLGDLNAWLSPLKIDSAGLESLGFPAAGRRKAAMLYHDTDRPAIVAAMVRHLQGLA